ncbi:response regulator [Flagellimonas baculiformis]|uniref:response regulator n=1 Tax=Flagellimonas baculiformis TaxID=3067310 RepID=UPI00296F75CE|nr:response regulator [Muricauda sp. D6]
MEKKNDVDRNTFTIFLVDDDKEDQEIFADALSEINRPIDLSIFDSGEKLFNALKIEGKRPDAIFLDLYMPIMNGEECLSELRKNQTFRFVPIVIYSTEFDMDRVERLFGIGANRYLRKPGCFDSLVASLDATMESLSRNPLGGYAVINIEI